MEVSQIRLITTVEERGKCKQGMRARLASRGPVGSAGERPLAVRGSPPPCCAVLLGGGAHLAF